jgi:hypothetical protein
MTPEEDYPRLLKVSRISASLLLLLFGGSATLPLLNISAYAGVFESMVEGGRQSLSALTLFFIEYQFPLIGAMSMVVMAALWLIWMSPRLSTIMLTTAMALVVMGLTTGLVSYAMQQPLLKVIRNFAG